MENAIHGFLSADGLITVGCVLLISVYLVVSGIPAIREIGLVKFLFGPVWNSNAAEPQFGILPFYPHQYLRYCGRDPHRCARGLYDRRVPGQNGPAKLKRTAVMRPR